MNLDWFNQIWPHWLHKIKVLILANLLQAALLQRRPEIFGSRGRTSRCKWVGPRTQVTNFVVGWHLISLLCSVKIDLSEVGKDLITCAV